MRLANPSAKRKAYKPHTYEFRGISLNCQCPYLSTPSSTRPTQFGNIIGYVSNFVETQVFCPMGSPRHLAIYFPIIHPQYKSTFVGMYKLTKSILNTTKSYMVVGLWCCIFELVEFRISQRKEIQYHSHYFPPHAISPPSLLGLFSVDHNLQIFTRISGYNSTVLVNGHLCLRYMW